MKKIVILLICVLSFTLHAQEQYQSHTVKEGETLTSIAKKYGISESEIIRLNPEVRKGVNPFNVLILPANASQNITFKKHRVKRKETLFSIAKNYGVRVDDIKKYNKHLYAKPLKKGEKIRIPIDVKKEDEEIVINDVKIIPDTSKTKSHTVQAKETKYGIARTYGITIAELEALNPSLPKNLPIGIDIKVPNKEAVSNVIIEEEKYEFYEVQPKEGFFRLKVKLGLTKDEIIALNPYAKEGLKDGMILKIPKSTQTTNYGDALEVNLEDAITNLSVKNIAVMLPFQLHKTVVADTTYSDQELLKNNRTLRIALDFYSGVLMAAEFAKEKGISINLNTYDTQGNYTKVESLINSNNFSNTDVVIGPLLVKNVTQASRLLEAKGIPVFSPLSNKETKMSANMFQTLPSNEMLEKGMLAYLKNNAEGKNVILICDNNRSKQKAKIVATLPQIKMVNPRKSDDGEYIYVQDIETKINKEQENWIVLESTNPVLISNVVGLLNGMKEENKVRLFTLDKNKNYEFSDISNLHLAHLNFTFPSIKKSYHTNEPNAFLTSYKNKYGVYPNRYAVRGFDVTYDILLRLASSDDVYEAFKNNYVTEYIENKFQYTKKMFSGFQNQAFYILKYNQNLLVEVVE
ncbi:MAG: amino acid ABC transporter substrate-binding protein [Flavobacteriales bacterium]